MAWLIILPIFVALFALLGVGLKAVNKAEQENYLLANQLRSEEMFRQALEERTAEVRRFRHDVNGLLQAIEFAGVANGNSPAQHDSRALGRDGEDGALSDKGPAVPKSLRRAFPLVGAIIDLKRIQCKEDEVELSIEIADSFADAAIEAGIAEADLCAMVQNLLENAYEASLRIGDAALRTIDLRMDCPDGQLSISVTNCTDSDERPTFQTNKAHPESHGVGLQTISKVISKYGGEQRVVFNSGQRMLTIQVWFA